MKIRRFCVFVLFLILAACSSQPEATAPAAEPVASADPLSGTWTGDWGPSESHRNNVTLDLKLDGAVITGSVNPGPDSISLTKGSFAADTGIVMMEADAKGHTGGMVHYVIEGKLDGNMMSGSWTHDDKKGDFKITKS
jgi:hypothetical protein